MKKLKEIRKTFRIYEKTYFEIKIHCVKTGVAWKDLLSKMWAAYKAQNKNRR